MTSWMLFTIPRGEVIPLYRDYRLRILREKRDEAEILKKADFTIYENARRLAHATRTRFKSRKRIASLLEEATAASKIAELQALLDKYPPEDVLQREAEIATNEEARAHTAYSRSLAAYQNAATEVSSRHAHVLWIDRVYGASLNDIFRQFGEVELICTYRKSGKRLDVFFGGQDFPLGDGHAHWIFNNIALAYRRDPGEK